MTAGTYTAIQLQVMARRFAAAEKLELARQVVREHGRYGFPITDPLRAAVHAAEQDYEAETTLAGWAVTSR